MQPQLASRSRQAQIVTALVAALMVVGNVRPVNAAQVLTAASPSTNSHSTPVLSTLTTTDTEDVPAPAPSVRASSATSTTRSSTTSPSSSPTATVPSSLDETSDTNVTPTPSVKKTPTTTTSKSTSSHTSSGSGSSGPTSKPTSSSKPTTGSKKAGNATIGSAGSSGSDSYACDCTKDRRVSLMGASDYCLVSSAKYGDKCGSESLKEKGVCPIAGAQPCSDIGHILANDAVCAQDPKDKTYKCVASKDDLDIQKKGKSKKKSLGQAAAGSTQSSSSQSGATTMHWSKRDSLAFIASLIFGAVVFL